MLLQVLTADRLEDITYRFSRICIEYKFLTAGNEDNGNLFSGVTETFCKADPIVFTQHNIKNQNVTAFGNILQCIFNSEIEVYFRISQDSPMDAKNIDDHF